MLLEKLEKLGYKSCLLQTLLDKQEYIQITNDTKAIYKILHVEYCRALFLDRCFFCFYCLLASSKILDPIMFADDTDCFHKQKNTIKLCATVNEELMNINDCLLQISSLECWDNEIFIDDLPPQLPKLSTDNQEINRASYTKFHGALLDENFS